MKTIVLSTLLALGLAAPALASHADCCKEKDGKRSACCEETEGKRMACCEKHEGHDNHHEGERGDHSQHQ